MTCRLHDELEAELNAGLFTGAQLCVMLRDELICDSAVGMAQPGAAMLPSTVHNLRCALKPIVGLCLAKALDDAGLDESVTVP